MPKPDIIYEKDFHFLDKTLLSMEQRRNEKKLKRQEKKKAANEIAKNESVESVEKDDCTK